MPKTSKILRAAGVLALVGATVAGCAASPVTEPTPPPLPALSSSERTQLYQTQVEAARDMLLSAHASATVPDVELVRFVLPSEWAQTMVGCMDEAGFAASVRPDGGIEFAPVADAQSEALSVANYVCGVQYPVDPTYARPLNDEQLKYLYWYFIEKLVPCLEAEGFNIPAPPSEATFVDQYDAHPWSPYSDVATSTEDAWIAINEKCPQMPSALFGQQD